MEESAKKSTNEIKNKKLKVHEDREWKLVIKNFREVDDISKEDWEKLVNIITSKYGWTHPSLMEALFELIRQLTTQYLSLGDMDIHSDDFVPFYPLYYQGKLLKTGLSIEILLDLIALHKFVYPLQDFIEAAVDAILKQINPSYIQKED